MNKFQKNWKDLQPKQISLMGREAKSVYFYLIFIGTIIGLALILII